jgi:hypothetical protein
MRNNERENVAWEVDNDRPVTFDRKGVIAVKPGARCKGVTARLPVDFAANRLNRGDAFRKLGLVRGIVATHDDSHPKTMSDDRFRVIGKRQIRVVQGIAAADEESLENLLEASRQIINQLGMQKLSRQRSYRHDCSR